MDIMQVIKDQIETNDILLYMKGSPNQPMCGFSARTVQAVMECGQKFAYVDILSNPEIRTNLPVYANWPTFPQLWVKGELVGGCLHSCSPCRVLLVAPSLLLWSCACMVGSHCVSCSQESAAWGVTWMKSMAFTIGVSQ